LSSIHSLFFRLFSRRYEEGKKRKENKGALEIQNFILLLPSICRTVEEGKEFGRLSSHF
jgi:hypothetical protein